MAGGRGKTVLSQSVFAAKARVICDATANAIATTHVVGLEIMLVAEMLRAYTRCSTSRQQSRQSVCLRPDCSECELQDGRTSANHVARLHRGLDNLEVIATGRFNCFARSSSLTRFGASSLF